MDNIWIFLIIIGAIASYAQKNQEKQPKKRPKPSNNRESEMDPFEAFERRLRELREGKQTTSHQPTIPTSPGKTSRRIAPRQKTSHNIDLPRKRIPTQHRGYTPTITNKPFAGTVAGTLEKKNEPSIAAATKQEIIAIEKNTGQKGKNNKIEHILKDFSMDKAVIYSEILKPKFEEY